MSSFINQFINFDVIREKIDKIWIQILSEWIQKRNQISFCFIERFLLSVIKQTNQLIIKNWFID